MSQMFAVSASTVVQESQPDDKTIVPDILIRIHRDGDQRSLCPYSLFRNCNLLKKKKVAHPDQVNRIME